MSEIVMHRVCGCTNASASGPRVVQVGAWHRRRYAISAQYAYVEMACDQCNTPWRALPLGTSLTEREGKEECTCHATYFDDEGNERFFDSCPLHLDDVIEQGIDERSRADDDAADRSRTYGEP